MGGRATALLKKIGIPLFRVEGSPSPREHPGRVALDPKLVIIGQVLNDPEMVPLQPLRKYFNPPVWRRRFHVLRLLNLGWNWIDVYRLGGGDCIRYLHAPGHLR